MVMVAVALVFESVPADEVKQAQSMIGFMNGFV
jgi:hypothetical protein